MASKLKKVLLPIVLGVAVMGSSVGVFLALWYLCKWIIIVGTGLLWLGLMAVLMWLLGHNIMELWKDRPK